MNKHGLFVRGGHPTDEMRAKIKRGVERHWKTTRKRSARIMEAKARSEQVAEWVENELAKARAATALRELREEMGSRSRSKR